jgi:hypothetical protein
MTYLFALLSTVLTAVFALIPTLAAQDAFSSNPFLNHDGRMTTTTGKQAFTYTTRSTQQGDVCTRITEYFGGNSPSGKAFARVEVRYKVPSFETLEERFEDTRTGFLTTVQRTQVGFVLKHRALTTSTIQQSTLQRTPSQMATAVLIPFMQHNFDTLNKGQELTFDLILPSRLESINFQVRKTGTAIVNDIHCITIALEPTSWIFQQLAPKTAFHIEVAAPHRFIEYRGRLAVKDNTGNDMDGVSTAQYK